MRNEAHFERARCAASPVCLQAARGGGSHDLIFMQPPPFLPPPPPVQAELLVQLLLYDLGAPADNDGASDAADGAAGGPAGAGGAAAVRAAASLEALLVCAAALECGGRRVQVGIAIASYRIP